MRADQLELPFLVLHPGAHLGAGEEAGLDKIAASIDAVHACLPRTKTRIALETTAGQGSCLGDRFEQIAYISHTCANRSGSASVSTPRTCTPPAMIFPAKRPTRKMFAEFDRVIGLERLAALHLNDSKTARGSRVDRHEHIGQGKIGLPAFRFIMRDRRFRKIPKVLETPKGKELREDVENMKTLRELLAD